jgi:glycosyltransferase involved in cell wall biosynthesis
MSHSSVRSVTIVVPTFNRGEPLRVTLSALLASATDNLDSVEIIVVDDGSPRPAAPLVSSLSVRAPFSLRCIHQLNSGPGPARNTGFRAAHGSIVIFVDDDIIAPPGLIEEHLRAHARHPRTVICGLSALIEPALPTPLYRFVSSLSGDSIDPVSGAEFVEVDIPASGHISVERAMFDPASAIYSDNLSTPAAEEFELAYRLKRAGIPILLAPRIIAAHDQPIDLASICRQQYKHALGTAEVITKYPATRSLPALERIRQANLEPTRGLTPRTLKRAALRCLTTAPLRAAALRTIQAMQYMIPMQRVDLGMFYRAIVSAHYHAGLRDGARREWS